MADGALTWRRDVRRFRGGGSGLAFLGGGGFSCYALNDMVGSSLVKIDGFFRGRLGFASYGAPKRKKIHINPSPVRNYQKPKPCVLYYFA